MIRKLISFVAAFLLMNSVIYSTFAQSAQAPQITQDQARETLINGYETLRGWDDQTWHDNIMSLAQKAREKNRIDLAEKLEAMSDPQLKKFVLAQAQNQINEMSQNGLFLIPLLIMIILDIPLQRAALILLLCLITFGDDQSASEI